MRLYYPARFVPYKGSFTVEFPDLPGCVTQGDSLEEAFEMAEDVACGWILTSIEDGEKIPSPSSIEKIENEDGFVNYISLDIDEYAKRFSSKAVKKTLTIPEWLNQLAEQREINFSQELQNALKVRLGLTANGIDECVSTLQESTKYLEMLLSISSTEFSQNTNSITVMHNTSDNIIHFPDCALLNSISY